MPSLVHFLSLEKLKKSVMNVALLELSNDSPDKLQLKIEILPRYNYVVYRILMAKVHHIKRNWKPGKQQSINH